MSRYNVEVLRGVLKDLDDSVLAVQVAGGSEQAFAVLVGRHENVVRRRIQIYGAWVDGLDADDVLQETFLRLWRHAGRWAPAQCQLSTWLCRIAINLCIDAARRVGRRGRHTDVDDVVLIDTTPGPEQSVAARDELHTVRKGLVALSERERLALLLQVSEDLPTRDIAVILAISAGAVEQLLVRARRKLRDRLRQTQ